MDPSKPASPDELLVSCETWREFVELYASDIVTGRLFVGMQTPPPVLSVFELRLRLPEATEVLLRVRVVQVVGDVQAAALGKPRGVGLEIVDMDAERKRQIYQLVEFARWQGATDDPNVSFSRTLLELSPALPPAEVGYRLSLMPAQFSRGSDTPLAGGAQNRASAAAKRGGQSADSPAPARNHSGGVQSAKATTVAPEGSIKPAGTRAARGSAPAAEAAVPAADAVSKPATPPKPSDPIKLKLVLTNFAHKHYDAALRVTQEMLASNPGDPQALRWQHMSNARLALGRDDQEAAADQYEQALQYADDNREAREFVRNYRRDKKLNSIPFGRYFTKKK
jgi:hypothetical protein